MIRNHQLTGPNNRRVQWSPSSSIQYQHTDIPIKSVICGKKYVSAVMGDKLTYELTLSNASGGDLIVTRDDINQALVSQIQVDGTAMGTIVSAAVLKPGIIDTLDFVANGGHMEATPYNSMLIQNGSTRTLRHEIFVPFGYYGCTSPLSMAPMTPLVKDANLKIDSPSAQVLPTGLTITSCFVTCSSKLVWRDEIIIPPGFQLTRHKSTATQGISSDTVELKSFGTNSTLTGVERRAAICALLWGSSLVSGDGQGAGLVANVTDISALFAGIEQTNDLYPLVMQLQTEYAREAPMLLNEFGVVGSAPAPIGLPVNYPLFATEKGWTPNTLSTMQNLARFLPIFPPRRRGQISKMPIADGSPSYNLTGNFDHSDHYSYSFCLYRWEKAQFDAMVEVIKSVDLGRFLYGDNNLTDLVKASKKNLGMNFSKATFLPRKLLPAGFVEVE